jgi:hypothetical protein
MGFKHIYESLMERLLANSTACDGGYVTECWAWLGNRDGKGYGRLSLRRNGRYRKLRVHRVSYEAFVGPIPPGLDVDHQCENRWCIAPDHLQPCEVKRNRGEFVRYGHPDGRSLSPPCEAVCG